MCLCYNCRTAQGKGNDIDDEGKGTAGKGKDIDDEGKGTAILQVRTMTSTRV